MSENKLPQSTEYLGKILIDASVISRSQLEECLEDQKGSNRSLGQILVSKGYCSTEEVTSAYALQIGIRYIKLSDFEIEPLVVNKIPLELARKHVIFPIHVKKDTLLLAMADPLNQKVINSIEFFLGCRVEPVISTEEEISEAIKTYYKDFPEPEEKEAVDEQWEKELELQRLKEEDGEERGFSPGNMVGRSKVMIELYKNIFKVAKSNATVLLLGESGTGKEIIAEAVHNASNRSGHPFIKVSCAALPESLLESELFGHEKGAFTGAFKRRLGRFELANGGTLFLDEIGELSLNIQVKLLRVLQQRMITRLGGMESIPIDVRILAATNRDLKKAVDEGTFRKDLYYRLNVISFMLPPLRRRKEDIPLLVEHFLNIYNKREQKNITSLHPLVIKVFNMYDWPGNVRELENCIERAVVMAEGSQIRMEHLPYNMRDIEEGDPNVVEKADTPVSLEDLEKQQILKTLRDNHWNMNITAGILGIHRNTLRRKLAQYNIVKPGKGGST